MQDLAPCRRTPRMSRPRRFSCSARSAATPSRFPPKNFGATARGAQARDGRPCPSLGASSSSSSAGRPKRSSLSARTRGPRRRSRTPGWAAVLGDVRHAARVDAPPAVVKPTFVSRSRRSRVRDSAPTPRFIDVGRVAALYRRRGTDPPWAERNRHPTMGKDRWPLPDAPLSRSLLIVDGMGLTTSSDRPSPQSPPRVPGPQRVPTAGRPRRP
jgi:hypothetical protein